MQMDRNFATYKANNSDAVQTSRIEVEQQESHGIAIKVFEIGSKALQLANYLSKIAFQCSASEHSLSFLLNLEARLLEITDIISQLQDENCVGPSANRLVSNDAYCASKADQTILRNIKAIDMAIKFNASRSSYFEHDIFCDPSWNVILDLAAAHAKNKKISIISSCIASGAPTTTALRKIKDLEELGLIIRECDPRDRRRTFLGLSNKALKSLARYLTDVGSARIDQTIPLS